MKEIRKTHLSFQIGLTTLACACLLACGGGGTSATDAQLSGTAAYGAPMVGASITVTDSSGQTVTTTTASNGTYTVKVTGFTAPILVKSSSISGDSIKEYVALVAATPKAGETGTANVTPLTHALVTMVSSDGTNPSEFKDLAKLKALDTAKLTTALGSLQTALKDVLIDAGLPINFDPLTTAFKADRTSAADVLLDTIKVTVSDQGVALTNTRVPVVSDSTTSISSTVTIKGSSSTAPAALPKPSVNAEELKGLDKFQTEVNACLSLAPAERVSKNVTGAYTFLGACANVTAFASNYKSYGYTLSQLWGPRLLNQLPQGSTIDTPEFLLFLDDGNKALVRLASSSPNGGRVYFETAVKTASGWQIVGNQRNYDASVGVRIYRQTDLSTNGWTIPSSYTNSTDAGSNVGKFDAYTSRLNFGFNQSGPNGSDVYAVRIKGPGLPVSGIVMARSSACGTADYLGFYRNNGTLPPVNATALPASSSATSWTLDVKNFGSAYKGKDFYNQYRGLSNTGAASTSTSNSIATQAVDMKSIPEFALYTWEVFTTVRGSIPAETFTSRIVTRPLAASEGSKLAWANLKQDALDYIDPTNTSKNVELTSASFSWALPNTAAPAVTSAYMFGSNTAGRINMGQSVAKLGDTSVNLIADAEADGNGKVCSYAKVPTFTATEGSREVGLRQTTDRGLTLQQYSYHNARVAN